MFSKLIARVEAQLVLELPFVVYSKPGSEKVVAIFQEDGRLHYVNDFSEKGFVFAPFDTDDPCILIPFDETMSASFNAPRANDLRKSVSPGPEEDKHSFYTDLVKKAMREIHLGTFEKVVVSRTLTPESKSSPLDRFQELLSTYDRAFCYLWYHPKIGMWLGATPEILLRTKGKELTTMSLAGTKPYVEGEDPIWEAKETEEQALVTDYIFERLKDNVDDLNRSHTVSVRAGNLWHLRTEISGTMRNNGLTEIIRALHPTPAVCGVPMPASKAFILKNEDYDREYYTGFLGELNIREKAHGDFELLTEHHGNDTLEPLMTELFVNLRCMQVKGERVVIYVGGGITRDSVPEEEWQETVDKSNTILKVL